jgi:ribosomal protein S4
LDNLTTNFFKINTKSLITFNRKIISKFFNFKLKKQYRITRFINSFLKYKVKDSIKFFENTLANILISSKLTFNSKQTFIFLKSGLIYVNGKLNNKADFFLKKGDLIQLVFTTTYLSTYKTYFNFTVKLNQKHYNRFFKNSSFLEETELSFKELTAVKNLTIFKKNFPKYLEVDFLTFSCYVVYTPFNLFYINNSSNYLYNYYLNRLYN